ncbi:hypothetical protein WA026_019692 [Henosepilachna vigintioctopunctata]|uniref:Odorant receptor n=1 Tax=Henosepilachna vigintioctopunctata TaxID=420089 RepID=A0AAW1ULT5_9CUCU
MGLIDNAHPFAVSHFVLKLMSVDAETPNGRLQETIKLFTITIIFGFPVFLGLGGTSIMAKSGSMMYEKIESLSYIVHTFVHSSYALIYVYFGYELKLLSYKIGVRRFGRSNDFLHNCYTLNKNTLRVLALVAFFVFLQANYNYIWKSRCISRNQLNDEKFVCGLVLTAWYPFKIDGKVEYAVIMVWYFAFCIIFVPLGVSFSIILFGFPMFMITKMKCLRKEVEQVQEVKSECFRRKFRKYVEEYREILE